MKIIAFLFFFFLTIAVILYVPWLPFKYLHIKAPELAYLLTGLWFLIVGAGGKWIGKQLESIAE